MENGVVNLARELVSRNVRTDVCCIDASGEFADRLPEDSRLHVLGKAEGFKFGAARKLSRLVRSEGPDVVHAHGLGALVYAGLAKLVGPRFRLLMGEHGSLQPRDLAKRRLLLRKWLYRLCNGVHTVSHSLTEELRHHGFGFANPVSIVNGVDTERFRPAEDRADARVATGLPPEAVVVGIVGRFFVFKRHDMLLDAFDKIAPDSPNAHLLIVGDRGDAEASIRARVASSPFEERIHLPGFTPEPERYYRAMDLMAMPSEIEGMSNALLESMACGVPTLCSEACGNAEVITHGEDGLLAALPDGDALAEHLRTWLGQTGRLERIGLQARETVKARFSMAAMAERYYDLYQSIIAKGRPARVAA